MSHKTAVKLRSDEEVILILHRHWFVLVTKTFFDVILFFIPIVLILVFAGEELVLGNFSISLFTSPSISFLTIGIWGAFVWMHFFNQWTDHYLDGWIITDKRIIDIEQRGFFSRQVSSFRIERIQDITSDVHGIIATFLDFGDVHVHTAGGNDSDHEFIIRSAPHPKQIKELILKESDRTIDQSKTDSMTATTGASL